MTDEKNTTTGSPYAPWDLRRLPNFDFSEFLCKVEKPGGKGQTVEMSLEGTKRWFRLACPNGGLVLNPLRVADTMAIFEARVFADAGDRNPLASFIATQRAGKATGDTYIRAAQDAALEGALRASGFSLEVSLLARTVGISAAAAQPSQTDGGEQPAKAPEPSPAPAQTDTPVQKAAGGAAPAAGKAAQQPKPAADTAPRPAPVGCQRHFKMSFFAEIECRFLRGGIQVLYSLIHHITCRLEARQALVYQLVSGLTGENGEYNYSKAVHLYPPFFDIFCSPKNYKIASALTFPFPCPCAHTRHLPELPPPL